MRPAEREGLAAANLSTVRDDFPILNAEVHGHPLVYLDNASTTQKPQAVVEAMKRYYLVECGNVHRAAHHLGERATQSYEAARVRLARFIGASLPDEVIFTRGTTEAINLVAQSWGRSQLRAGDEILLTEMEHHSNLVPWQLLAKEVGARLRFLPVTGPEGTLVAGSLETALNPRVRLLAFTHVSNSLGVINPVAEMCRKAREAGVVTLVDAAQSAGHMPLDVREIGCDFLAFSGHKMCGPTGIGVLYGRRELLEVMPPWQGGGEMIERVELEESTFRDPPQRFEAGTPPIAEAYGLAEAAGYLDSLGREAILRHDQALAQHARKLLGAISGVRLFGPETGGGPVVSFQLEGVHPHDVATFADQWGVAVRGGHHCCQPLMRRLGVDGTVRASFGLYNTLEEVKRLAEVVRQAQAFFGAL